MRLGTMLCPTGCSASMRRAGRSRGPGRLPYLARATRPCPAPPGCWAAPPAPCASWPSLSLSSHAWGWETGLRTPPICTGYPDQAIRVQKIFRKFSGSIPGG
eukprot:COSAG01_NODE_10998_length_2030_cov_2.434490_4_plen_101_part_01